MKVFLCGQGPAAERILRKYCDRFEKLALFTHQKCHIYNVAVDLKIPALLNSVNNQIAWPFDPDLIISIYYRTIIKPPVIEALKGNLINAHASLLPRHKGRSPIPWAIVDDDDITGITYHYIDFGVDTGPVILQAACQIDHEETQLSLFNKINSMVVAYFPAALALVEAGFKGVPQRGEGTVHQAGPPFGGEISPYWNIDQIERFIRAMTYPPLPHATYCGVEIKSLEDYRAVKNDHLKSRDYNAVSQ